MKRKYGISATCIDKFLWDLELEAWELTKDIKMGTDSVRPIIRYVRTGRASADFLLEMFSHRPQTIARRCLLGGSDEEIVNRVKKYCGF